MLLRTGAFCARAEPAQSRQKKPRATRVALIFISVILVNVVLAVRGGLVHHDWKAVSSRASGVVGAIGIPISRGWDST